MKFNRRHLGFIASAVLIIAAVIGCTTTAQRNAFTTIASVESAATAAFDGYSHLVVTGVVPTNDVPKVAAIYNQIQAAGRLAETASMAGTNALAPATLSAELGDLLNLIATIVPAK